MEEQYVHSMDPEEMRGKVAEAIDRMCPSITGDPRFEKITQGQSLLAEKQHWFCSTCTFPVMWLLNDVLGYADPRVVNRDVPARRLTYKSQKSITMIHSGGLAAGVFVNHDGKNRPERGDCLYVAGATQDTEHVEVFLAERHNTVTGEVVWDVAAAGQPSDTGRQCLIYKTRIYKNGTTSSSRGPRKVIGWISLSKLVGAYPVCFPQDQE